MFVCLVVLTVVSSYLSATAPPSENEVRKLQIWHATRLEDIERIELHPFDGSTSTLTVSGPVLITNSLSIQRIWSGLHSEHKFGYYLKGLDHWSTSRVAKLIVIPKTEEPTPLYLSWDDSVNAC